MKRDFVDFGVKLSEEGKQWVVDETPSLIADDFRGHCFPYDRMKRFYVFVTEDGDVFFTKINKQISEREVTSIINNLSKLGILEVELDYPFPEFLTERVPVDENNATLIDGNFFEDMGYLYE